MEEYRVRIPSEEIAIIRFRQDDFPGVMALNQALQNFEPKKVFAWHLSIMLQMEELIDNGMPSHAERAVLDPYGDYLDREIKGNDIDRPNALFLARITWNTTRELIWRVYNPETVHIFLQQHLRDKAYARVFDYRIDPDESWKLASWHLGTVKED